MTYQISTTGEPVIKANREPTCHKDGTMSYWSVYEQVWTRQLASYIPDREIAAMNDKDRRRCLALRATVPPTLS